VAILCGFAAARLEGQLTVATHRYDGARVGANLSETILAPAGVSVSTFGKLYSYSVDGSVYAQPLYVPGLTIGGTPRNVLFVATMNDKVYAFDADSMSSSPLWIRDFTNPPSVTPVPITDISAPNFNIVGNVGIQSTPVIDTSTGTIYLVARTKENGAYVQRLHALDIVTGASRVGSPVTISGSVPGDAADAIAGPSGRVVVFNPKMQAQRTALALSNGVILIAWASHEDLPPFHGWIMGYDAATLAKVGTFCVTPDGYYGGIWQGGRAPTIDAAGHAYFATGNGYWDGTRNFSESLLKFSVSRAGLALVDYFTPAYGALNSGDFDLSGSGFTLLPGTNLLLGGGKEGSLYLLDAARLGHMASGDGQIPQKIPVAGGHVMGGPVFWNSGAAGALIYNWSENDVLRAYRWNGSRLQLPSSMEGAVLSPGHPGGSLTVSANGNTGGTGIVWASMPLNEDAMHGLHAGVLRAFNAETLNEIWNSEQNPSRDRTGTLMKFVPPLVVNGRVYMPNHDNAVSVYGLLERPPDSDPSPGRTISIDFVGGAPAPMDATESAGVVAARNWNAAVGASRATPLPLVDSTGAPTSATVTWAAPGGIWQLPTTDQPGNVRMMKGYLDTGNTTQVAVTVAGLPQATYDVYVYVDGDNKSFDRSATYAVSGPGLATTTIDLTDPANTNFNGTFTRAAGSSGNYVRFTLTATGFTIEASPTTPADATRRAPVNGIQIVRQGPQQGGGTDRTMSVDFVGNGVAMDPAETAGTIAKSHWNAAFGAASSAPLRIVDETGASTSATVTWSAGGTWTVPIADQPGSARMMRGYLDTKGAGTATVTVAGLTQGSYDLYVYIDGDNGSFDRGAAYTVSGPGIETTTVGVTDAAGANFSGTFVRGSNSAGNYVRFTIDAAGFTLQATPTTPEGGTRRAPLNGIQIVPLSVPPQPSPIGIDFNGNSTSVMAASETAGVVAQSHWNSGAGAVRTTPLALADASGRATTASVTWTANGVWTLPIADEPGDMRMMLGYLDTSSTSETTVTVSGLPSGSYDVYVYVDGDNHGYTRTANYRVTAAGSGQAVIGATDTANVNFSGTFTQASGTAGNYVKFAISGDGFTLVATPSTGTNPTLRAPVNAVQIVPR